MTTDVNGKRSIQAADFKLSVNPLLLNWGFARLTAGEWEYKNVTSPYARIYCVTEGEATVRMGEKVLHLVPGHLYIIPPYCTHSCHCDRVFSHYYLHFYEEIGKGPGMFDLLDMPLEVPGKTFHQQMFETICTEYPQASLLITDPKDYDNEAYLNRQLARFGQLFWGDQVQLRGAVYTFLSEFLKRAKQKSWTRNKHIIKALHHIDTHLTERLDCEQLGSVANLSANSLIRLFRTEMHITPLQYIIRKRVQRAQTLLLTTHTKINDIAFDLGFTDVSYFIRQFRKQTGTTPQQYREQLIKETTF